MIPPVLFYQLIQAGFVAKETNVASNTIILSDCAIPKQACISATTEKVDLFGLDCVIPASCGSRVFRHNRSLAFLETLYVCARVDIGPSHYYKTRSWILWDDDSKVIVPFYGMWASANYLFDSNANGFLINKEQIRIPTSWAQPTFRYKAYYMGEAARTGLTRVTEQTNYYKHCFSNNMHGTFDILFEDWFHKIQNKAYALSYTILPNDALFSDEYDNFEDLMYYTAAGYYPPNEFVTQNFTLKNFILPCQWLKDGKTDFYWFFEERKIYNLNILLWDTAYIPNPEIYFNENNVKFRNGNATKMPEIVRWRFTVVGDRITGVHTGKRKVHTVTAANPLHINVVSDGNSAVMSFPQIPKFRKFSKSYYDRVGKIYRKNSYIVLEWVMGVEPLFWHKDNNTWCGRQIPHKAEIGPRFFYNKTIYYRAGHYYKNDYFHIGNARIRVANDYLDSKQLRFWLMDGIDTVLDTLINFIIDLFRALTPAMDALILGICRLIVLIIDTTLQLFYTVFPNTNISTVLGLLFFFVTLRITYQDNIIAVIGSLAAMYASIIYNELNSI